MTIRDFMNYLIYVEYSAENLQFFLWYKEYILRFQDAQTSDKALAPEWTQAMQDETLSKIKKATVEKTRSDLSAAHIFRGTDFEKRGEQQMFDNKDPFTTPPRTAQSNCDASTIYSGSQTTSHRSQAQDAFAAVGAKQPCKSQACTSHTGTLLTTR